jgi:hypothetical protein
MRSRRFIPGPLLPVLDEADDLIITLISPDLAVGVTEHAGVGVLGQEGQNGQP